MRLSEEALAALEAILDAAWGNAEEYYNLRSRSKEVRRIKAQLELAGETIDALKRDKAEKDFLAGPIIEEWDALPCVVQ